MFRVKCTGNIDRIEEETIEVIEKISETRLIKIINKETEFKPNKEETKVIEELLEEIA